MKSDPELITLLLKFQERYFKDMTFRLRYFQKFYTQYEIQNDKRTWTSTDSDLPIYLELDGYQVVRIPLEDGLLGICYPMKKRLIKITTTIFGREVEFTLLHEMTHAYENHLIHYGITYPYFVFIYERLKKLLGRKKIESILSIFGHSVLTQIPGHSMLFWLKTIELDLKVGQPFGTIAGYEKMRDLKSLIKI